MVLILGMNVQEDSGKRFKKWSYFELILKVRTDT